MRDRVEDHMKADAESWMSRAEARRFGARGQIHHHAGARQDPLLVGLDDAAVDAAARPEVVTVDDQALHRAGSTGLTASSHSIISARRSGSQSDSPSRASARLQTSRLASRA